MASVELHSFVTLGFQSEIHHHDAVLFHDADEENNSDDRHYVEIQMEEQ